MSWSRRADTQQQSNMNSASRSHWTVIPRQAVKRGAVTVALAAIIIAILTACGGKERDQPSQAASDAAQAALQTQVVSTDKGTYKDVDVSSLSAMLQEKDFPLVNVHVPYEGEIEGTDLFIRYDEIETNLDRLPGNKDAMIVLYCRSGSMSTTAARTLASQGYTDVWNLDGGMIAWEQAGYPLIDSNR